MIYRTTSTLGNVQQYTMAAYDKSCIFSVPKGPHTAIATLSTLCLRMRIAIRYFPTESAFLNQAIARRCKGNTLE